MTRLHVFKKEQKREKTQAAITAYTSLKDAEHKIAVQAAIIAELEVEMADTTDSFTNKGLESLFLAELQRQHKTAKEQLEEAHKRAGWAQQRLNTELDTYNNNYLADLGPIDFSRVLW